MLKPRPKGFTLTRAVEALRNPHPATERFDPQFPVAMQCSRCGKYAHGPRSLMQEAMRVHMESECPARHTKADETVVTHILYPRL